MKKKSNALLCSVIRRIALWVLVVAVAVCGTACGDEETTVKKGKLRESLKSETKVTEAPTGEVTPEVTPAETTKTLTLWCTAVETSSERMAYDQAINELSRRYPDITINMEASPNDDYKFKLKSAMSTGDIPDIFYTWGCSFLSDFVDIGRVYCLDKAYGRYSGRLTETMCRNTMYNGKKYGIPMSMTVVTLFVNMDLLRTAGFDSVPTDYDSLVACCDALKAQGITPFGCSREEWCISEYIEPIILKTVGAATLDGIFRGKLSWDNNAVANAIDIFQNFIRKGYFAATDAYRNHDEVKTDFMKGRYAFYQNGSWNCADMANNCEFDVRVSEFPVMDASRGKTGQLIGGPTDALAVSAETKDPELTAQVAYEFAELVSKYNYLFGGGLPAWKVDYSTDDVNPLLRKVAEMVHEADYLVLYGDTAMPSSRIDDYLMAIAKVYNGIISGTGFVNEMKLAE